MGIFAVELAGLGPSPLPGAASLGVRPTVRSDATPVLEVHLFDFDRDVYGQRVQVRFFKKLRDEEKYPDLDTLTAAIARDVIAAQKYFSNRSGAPAQRFAEK
jgi:riboflavin kinase/FMN adenylyltransferase